MNRRAFVTGLTAALIVPLHLAAESRAAAARIGILGNSDVKAENSQLTAFRQGLGELGWVEGKTIVIDYQSAGSNADRLPQLARELVRLKSDVIVVSGSAGVRAARQATDAIPIVIAAILVDPVNAGFVASLSRPGGNVTGLSSQYEEIVGKQVQLLTETIPGLSRLAVLRDASVPGPTTATAATTAANKLGAETQLLQVKHPGEFESAFRSAHAGHAQAIHVLPSPFFNAHRELLIRLAAAYRLPALYEFRDYVEDGGLMSYGVDIREMYRRAASFVDRILKGAKPGDLPIERATKFEFVINMKTAKALGLTIPPSLLLRADQVIE